jgi:hypothetical protein
MQVDIKPQEWAVLPDLLFYWICRPVLPLFDQAINCRHGHHHLADLGLFRVIGAQFAQALGCD